MKSTGNRNPYWLRWAFITTLLAMSLASAFGGGVWAQSNDSGPLPTGDLTVSLDESALAATLSSSPELRGRWTLSLNDDGSFTLARADAGVVVIGNYSAGPASIQFTRWDGIIGCRIEEGDAAARYAWSANGPRIAFTSVNDTCTDRVDLLTTREFGSLAACETALPRQDDPFAFPDAAGTPEPGGAPVQGVTAQEGYSEEAELDSAVDVLLRQVSGCWDASDVDGFMALHSQDVQSQIAMMGPPEPFVSELQAFMQLPLHLERIGSVRLGDSDRAWVYVEVDLDGQALPQRVNLVRESGNWLLDSFFLFGPPPPEGAPFA